MIAFRYDRYWKTFSGLVYETDEYIEIFYERRLLSGPGAGEAEAARRPAFGRTPHAAGISGRKTAIRPIFSFRCGFLVLLGYFCAVKIGL